MSENDPASPFVVDFVNALRGQGIAPSVFTPKIGDAIWEYPFPVYRFEWGEKNHTLSELNILKPSSWRKINNYFTCGKKSLVKHLEENDYDHILALWALPSGWLAQQASELTGIPYSIWALGSDINVWASRPLAGGMIRRALRRANHLFADGGELAEKVTSISGHECHFLPSFHSLKLPSGNNVKEKMFIYLGRLEKKKGIYDLLKAFRKIKCDIRDYSLLYLGEGSQKEKLEKRIDRYNLRGKVHVIGWVNDEEKLDFLRRCRAIIMPTHSDSIPLVFGEALQLAIPMVVTEVGDLGTLVRENKLGFAVRKKSVKQLTDAMTKMIVTEYDVKESSDKLLKIFNPQAAAVKFLDVINGSKS